MARRTHGRIGAGSLPGQDVVCAVVIVVCLVVRAVTHAPVLLLVAIAALSPRPPAWPASRRSSSPTATPPRVLLPHSDARATATTPATPATAARAVRDFLADAVLEDNAYAACGYLTPAAQQHVTTLAGEGRACRTAVSATRPGFAGIQSEGDLRGLPLHATVRGRTALVRATPRSGRPVTFVLQEATPGAGDAYRAPACAWRIAAGETAVLPGAVGGGGT
jgi:hypothetical protein